MKKGGIWKNATIHNSFSRIKKKQSSSQRIEPIEMSHHPKLIGQIQRKLLLLLVFRGLHKEVWPPTLTGV